MKYKMQEMSVIPAVALHTEAEPPTTPQLTVEVVDNHIYFYSDITSDRVLALTKALRETANRFRAEYIDREYPTDYPRTPIWLHIQSQGGDAFAALAAADQIQQMAKHTHVWSVVEGYCASGATILSMACGKRYIRPSAMMMIHQLTAGSWGTYEQLKDEMKVCEMLMERFIEFYSTHSKLSASEVEALLKHDSWFNAQECVENGLADEVLT